MIPYLDERIKITVPLKTLGTFPADGLYRYDVLYDDIVQFTGNCFCKKGASARTIDITDIVRSSYSFKYPYVTTDLEMYWKVQLYINSTSTAVSDLVTIFPIYRYPNRKARLETPLEVNKQAWIIPALQGFDSDKKGEFLPRIPYVYSDKAEYNLALNAGDLTVEEANNTKLSVNGVEKELNLLNQAIANTNYPLKQLFAPDTALNNPLWYDATADDTEFIYYNLDDPYYEQEVLSLQPLKIRARSLYSIDEIGFDAGFPGSEWEALTVGQLPAHLTTKISGNLDIDYGNAIYINLNGDGLTEFISTLVYKGNNGAPFEVDVTADVNTVISNNTNIFTEVPAEWSADTVDGYRGFSYNGEIGTAVININVYNSKGSELASKPVTSSKVSAIDFGVLEDIDSVEFENGTTGAVIGTIKINSNYKPIFNIGHFVLYSATSTKFFVAPVIQYYETILTLDGKTISQPSDISEQLNVIKVVSGDNVLSSNKGLIAERERSNFEVTYKYNIEFEDVDNFAYHIVDGDKKGSLRLTKYVFDSRSGKCLGTASTTNTNKTATITLGRMIAGNYINTVKSKDIYIVDVLTYSGSSNTAAVVQYKPIFDADVYSISSPTYDTGSVDLYVNYVGNPTILRSTSFDVAKIDICPSRYYLQWRDRYGSMQMQPFNKIDTYKEDFERTEMKDYIDSRRLSSISIQPQWTLNTGWLNDSVYPYYESLLISPWIKLYDTKEDQIYDAIITKNDYTEKTFINQSKQQFNLQLDVESINKQNILY